MAAQAVNRVNMVNNLLFHFVAVSTLSEVFFSTMTYVW